MRLLPSREICAQRSGGSAERVGFLSQRVLTEIQVGFRPHMIFDLSQNKIDSTLDFNPQIFCGYAANLSDCGWGSGNFFDDKTRW